MLLLIQIDSTLALSGIRDDIAGALIDQDFCYSHLIALYPLQLYSQMLVPKKSTLLINARIVSINKVLSIRAKRMLMSGGLFCEALKEKKTNA